MHAGVVASGDCDNDEERRGGPVGGRIQDESKTRGGNEEKKEQVEESLSNIIKKLTGSRARETGCLWFVGIRVTTCVEVGFRFSGAMSKIEEVRRRAKWRIRQMCSVGEGKEIGCA